MGDHCQTGLSITAQPTDTSLVLMLCAENKRERRQLRITDFAPFPSLPSPHAQFIDVKTQTDRDPTQCGLNESTKVKIVRILSHHISYDVSVHRLPPQPSPLLLTKTSYLYENMTSATKPDVHTAFYVRRGPCSVSEIHACRGQSLRPLNWVLNFYYN